MEITFEDGRRERLASTLDIYDVEVGHAPARAA